MHFMEPITYNVTCCVGNKMFNQIDDDKFNSNRCLTMIMNFYKLFFFILKFQLVFNISSLRLANRFVTLINNNNNGYWLYHINPKYTNIHYNKLRKKANRVIQYRILNLYNNQ